MGYITTYVIQLIVWPVLMVLLMVIFRYFPRKIKDSDEPVKKNLLFILMLIFGLSLLVFEVVAPVMVLMGDEHMPSVYKYIFGVEVLILAIYLYRIQRTRSHEAFLIRERKEIDS
jgi:hypothetical protein